MKNLTFLFAGLLLISFAAVGCAKKSTEEASISGTGFDSISSTEELAQLPQSSTANQQTAVEVLPIEASPITQGIPPITGPTSAAARKLREAQQSVSTMATDMESMSQTVTTAVETLSREKQIQTALKNAGLYQGSIDGKIGPASKRAVEAFQTSHQLKVDGKVGPQTWAALEPYLTGAPQTETLPSEE